MIARVYDLAAHRAKRDLRRAIVAEEMDAVRAMFEPGAALEPSIAGEQLALFGSIAALHAGDDAIADDLRRSYDSQA